MLPIILTAPCTSKTQEREQVPEQDIRHQKENGKGKDNSDIVSNGAQGKIVAQRDIRAAPEATPRTMTG